MGYNIRRSEVNIAGASSIGRNTALIDGLGRIQESFQKLVDDNSFTGSGAEAIKNYIQTVHINTIQAINVALQEYYLLFASYAYGLSDYDTNNEAILNEDCFTELVNKLSFMLENIEIAHQASYSAESDVEDILQERFISTIGVYKEPLEDEKNKLIKLRDGIGAYDADFKNSKLNNVRELIDDARKIVDALREKGVVTFEELNPLNYLTQDHLIKLSEDASSAVRYISDNKDKLNDDIRFVCDYAQKKYEEELEKARKNRIEKGIILICTAVIEAIGVVATAGATAPLAVEVIWATAATYIGLDTMSKVAEGTQDIYYGATGEMETASINLMRDVAFDGDQEAYDITTIIASGIMVSSYSLGNIYFVGGGEIASAGSVAVEQIGTATEEVLKAGTGVLINDAGEKIATSCSDDQLARFIIQVSFDVTASSATNGLIKDAVKSITTKYNGANRVNTVLEDTDAITYESFEREPEQIEVDYEDVYNAQYDEPFDYGSYLEDSFAEDISTGVYEEVQGISGYDIPEESLAEVNVETGGSNIGLNGIEGVGKSGKLWDYSNHFEDELNNFNDGYIINNVIDEDMYLVQFHSDAEVGFGRSLKYWTTVDEANGISTIDEYMDQMALMSSWGERDNVSIAKIPAGTVVKYAVGTAREQIGVIESRPGGGLQILFEQFNDGWIVETRPIP